MKTILVIFFIVFGCANRAKAQLQIDANSENTYHIIKMHPWPLIDPLSERLQLAYERFYPIKHFGVELGGAYIFNEKEINGLQDIHKNFWANGWSVNMIGKFYNKNNNRYIGMQGKIKMNYMHWDSFWKEKDYERLINYYQTKQVIIAEFVAGFQEITKKGFAYEFGFSLGVRNKSYLYNGERSFTNKMYEVNNNSGFQTGSNGSMQSTILMPSISIFYKMGIGFSTKNR
jgi:hypothetical protein